MTATNARSSWWTYSLALLAVQAAVGLVASMLAGGWIVPVVSGLGFVGTAVLLARWSFLRRRTIAHVRTAIDRIAHGEWRSPIASAEPDDLAPVRESLSNLAQQIHEQTELLKAQHSEQSIIQQSMSTGMIALDLNERILSINRAAQRLLALDAEETKGQLLRDVVHEPELNRFVAAAARSVKPASVEFKLVTRSGITIHAIGEPLRNRDDKPVGLLVLLNDVTRLRRLEAMRSDFAANVSHELRTPITNIKGYVETLLEVGVADAEQTTKFLEIIHRNTERLAHIIEDLLALARLEQPDAQGALQRKTTSLQVIVRSVMSQFEAAGAQRAINVEEDVPVDLRVNVNAQLIEQALGNLLSNAIKYSPSNTTVTMRGRLNAQNEIELAVIDQGPGIAREHLPRLFERFYRIDRARSREMGGTGLGLAIVKHIALVHGGSVDVRSEVGKGSVFRILLPAV